MQYLQEYLYGFRMNKGIEKKNFFYVVLFNFYFASLFGVFNEDYELYDVIKLLAVFVPMILIIISIIYHPACMTKMQYLCPMSREQRRQKIKETYLTRVIIHLIISVVGILILEKYIRTDLFFRSFVLVNDIVLSTLVFPSEKRRTSETGWGVILFYTVLIMVFFSNAIIASLLLDVEIDTVWKMVILLMALFILAPPYLKNIKHIKRTLEESIDFE